MTATMTANEQLADKLEDFADKLEKKIEALLRPRRENTRKQRYQASSARYDAHNLQNARDACLALSEAFRNGTAPAELEHFKHLSKIEEATRVGFTSGHGYLDPIFPEPDDFKDMSDMAVKLRQFVFNEESDTEKQDRLREQELAFKLTNLRGAQIDGFFPTPDTVIPQMIRGMGTGTFKVLEPSAGIGSIADFARDMGHDVLCIERHYELCEVLDLKGHNYIRGDFLEIKPVPIFDMVLMNPPFENNQAPKHVRHAFEFLKPSGLLCAVMPGMATRYSESRIKALQDFAEWADNEGAGFEPLPEGTFKSSFCPTGVSTVLLRVTK